MKSDPQNTHLNWLMSADPSSYTVYSTHPDRYPQSDVGDKLPYEHYPALFMFYALTGDSARLWNLNDMMDVRGIYISELVTEHLGDRGIRLISNYGSVDVYFEDSDFNNPFKFARASTCISENLELLKKKLGLDLSSGVINDYLLSDKAVLDGVRQAPNCKLFPDQIPCLRGDSLYGARIYNLLGKALDKTEGSLVSDVLVWSSPETVAKHEELYPFRRVIFGSKHGNEDYDDLSSLEYSEGLCKDFFDDYKNFIYGIEGAGRHLDPIDHQLLTRCSSDSLKMGLGFNPDRVLCRTSLDFLKTFEWHDQLPFEQKCAFESWESVVAEIIAANIAGRNSLQSVPSFSAIYSRDVLVSTICQGQFIKDSKLLDNFKYGIDGLIFRSSLCDLLAGDPVHAAKAALYRQVMGVSESPPVSIRLSEIYPSFLGDGEYKPVAGSIVVFEYDHMWDKNVERVIDNLLGSSLGDFFIEGIPTQGTVSEVFMAAQARGYHCKADSFIFEKVLANQVVRIEHLIPLITDDSGWTVLADMVGHEALKPYYNELPRRLRVQVAGAQLQL